jgi:hypothetical protein
MNMLLVKLYNIRKKIDVTLYLFVEDLIMGQIVQYDWYIEWIYRVQLPALVIASPLQCRVPDGPAESAEPSSKPAPTLSDTSTGKSGILVPVDAKSASASPASADSPMLKHLAQSGAQLSELSTGHGMRSVIARQGDQFMVFALAPDGLAAVAGLEAELSVGQPKRTVGDRMSPASPAGATKTRVNPFPAA